MTWNDKVARYDKLVAQNPNFERKGKTVPYTSANGHMFTLVNKDGDVGFRFSKQVQENYFNELNTSYLMSHGAKMNGYVMIPESLWKDEARLLNMLQESYEYVQTLEPK